MEEQKRKPGRPFGTTRESSLELVKIRLDKNEWEYFKTWVQNANLEVRSLIKEANDRHRRETKNQAN